MACARRATIDVPITVRVEVAKLRAIKLGIGGEAGWQVEAPSFRSDLGREIDYVEEVARVVGYDAFEPAMPTVTLTPVAVPESWRLAGQLRTLLAGLGMHHSRLRWAKSPTYAAKEKEGKKA